MPANRKAPGTRQDNSSSRALATVSQIRGGRQVEAPEARPVWLKATREAWDALWRSDVALAVGEHHLPAVFRLFELRDQQERAMRLYRRQPLVDGSQKQPVANPAMGTALSLERAITALEDRLGLTPKAQANLGIAIGQAGLTAAELNRMAQEAADDDDGDTRGWVGEAGAAGEPQDIVEAVWADA